MNVNRFVIAVALLFTLGPVLGATGLVAKPAAPAGVRSDCWLEHTQVQPPPREAGGGEYMVDAKSRLLAEDHVGSEHPSAAARKRSCNSEPPVPRLGERAEGLRR
jgi:hypothetical protein